MEKSYIQLYDFQEKIVDTALKRLQTKNRYLIVVPTGGGKTVIFSEIIRRTGFKTLVIAHTKELIEQAHKTLKMMRVQDHLVDIETIQKLAHPSNMLPSSESYEFIIIDECHRACSDSYEKIIKHFSKSKILGVTATPYRSDGKKITGILGFPEEPLNMMELIEKGFLCDFSGHRIRTGINLQSIAKTPSTKDFSGGALASVINVKERNDIIFAAYIKLGENRKTLGFGADVKHCHELKNTFNKNGIKSEFIHGELSQGHRELIINDFKEGKIKVLWNCQVLTEGFDEPSIECLLMARPTLSKRLYIQMIGRGSRIHDGKKDCKVIEFTDSDYDVCDLRDLLKLPKSAPLLIDGEKLSNYNTRIPKTLIESTGEIIDERWNVIIKRIESGVTDFQKKLAKQMGIEFSTFITEFQANIIISEKLMEKKNG